MQTEKLYYEDSHLYAFTAEVISCEQQGKKWRTVLDRSAFFPEGGGQSADTGYIGHVRVTDVHEKDGIIYHYTDGPCETGEAECAVDWEQRIRRMQNHSGEHVLSGLIHSLFGYDNVGFHMGDEFMTIDFSGELSSDDLILIERTANEKVRENIKVKTSFPDRDMLLKLEYRSKLELTENVRIVEIEGVDTCACCAPHVSSTGEIGMIKILSAERHRGGMRLSVVCGMDCLDEMNRMQDNISRIGGMLSAKRFETAEAVKHLLAERDGIKARLAETEIALVERIAASFEETDRDICLFPEKESGVSFSEPALRELVNLLMLKCRLAAVFTGSDDSGYRYIIGSGKLDIKSAGAEINSALSGKGGGRDGMISGRVSASESVIREYFCSRQQ